MFGARVVTFFLFKDLTFLKQQVCFTLGVRVGTLMVGLFKVLDVPALLGSIHTSYTIVHSH